MLRSGLVHHVRRERTSLRGGVIGPHISFTLRDQIHRSGGLPVLV